jgi:predicted outer membrane repeat protein
VQGGGLFQGTVTGRVDVIGGRFERNVAVGAYGGGVFIWDTLALTQTQILSNSSRDMGGGVYVGKFAYLVDTELIGNSSGQGGGLLQWDADGWVEAVGGHLASNVAEVNGGALYVGGSATLREIQVLSNVAGQFGGGLYQSSSEGAVNITGSRFEGNAAEWSGGGLSLAGSTVLSGTEVVSNTAGYNGGGLSGGEVDVIGGSLARNTATDDGGGLYASGALSLAGAQVVSNTAGRDGGGLYAKGAMEATNSLFVANGATVSGDALYLAGRSGAQTIVNLTIAHPTLRASEAIRVTSGTVAITNTIVASHTCGIAQLDGTLIEDHNLYFGHVKAIQSTGGTLITGDHSLYDLDPRFLNPFCGDYHLTVGSPAIDTGASSGAPGFDIDGDPRPQHAGYDIGADEYSGGYLVYLPAILSNY